MAKRAIVVTPSTLTQNWAAEVQKWLGSERCKALVMQPGPGAESQVNTPLFAGLLVTMTGQLTAQSRVYESATLVVLHSMLGGFDASINVQWSVQLSLVEPSTLLLASH